MNSTHRALDGPQIRADRIWAKVADIDVPRFEAERYAVQREIMAAVIEELGCRHCALMWQQPAPVESTPTELSAITNSRISVTDPITEQRRIIADSPTMAPHRVEQAISNWTQRDHTTRENADVWNEYIVHRDEAVGMITVCRYLTRDGRVTEADREVISKLSPRLAEMLYQWNVVRLDEVINR